MSDIEKYKSLLKHHDWYYEYADDHRAWRKGVDERNVLRALQVKLDPKGEIWNSVAPKDCQLVFMQAQQKPKGPSLC